MGNQFSRSNSTNTNKRGGENSGSSVGGSDTLRPNKQQKMIISDAPSNICSLPDPLLVHVSEYLALPSRALFAISLHNDTGDISEIRTRINVPAPELLDFGDIEKELAMRLTDDDLTSVLVCIDAKHNLKKLKLTNCRGIIGNGLAPLRQSVIIEQIDLSLVGKFESPILEGDTLLSESVTLPILQGIVDTEGSVLKQIVFPHSWANVVDTSQALTQFMESYSRHLNALRFCCASGQCRRLVNRDTWFSTNYDNHNPNMQWDTCYECGDMACRECSDGELPDRVMTHCEKCEKVFCKECVSPSGCDEEWCDVFGWCMCSGCVPTINCSNCDGKYCGDCCVDKCDVCGDGVCEGCQENDFDSLRTCANCDRKLCGKCGDVQYCQAYEDCCEVVCNSCQPRDWECLWCGDIDDYESYYDPKVKCSKCFKQSRTHCCRCGKKKIDESSYLLPTIPNSYWVSQGHDEAYVEAMESFLHRLKVTTLMLNSGEQLDYQELHFDGGEVLLQHDDILLPYWKEFMGALKDHELVEMHGGHTFSVTNVQLTPSVVTMLKESLSAMKLKFSKLEFRQSFVDNNVGLEFLSHHIQINPQLTHVFLSKNPVDNVESIHTLLNVINDHPTLCVVPFNKICGEGLNGYDILPAIISLLGGSKTYRVYLDSNNIRTNGGTLLSDLIMTNNPRLKNLSLKNNHFTVNDIRLIADALKQNANLESISFGESISDISRTELQNVIFDQTSCNALVNSNHICCIDGLDHDINNSSWRKCEKTIRKKLYMFFSMRNREGTNLHYLDMEFGEDLLKLLPRFFRFVMHNSPTRIGKVKGVGDNYYSDDNTAVVWPLSIMYEVIRKLPSQDDVSKKMESGCVIS